MLEYEARIHNPMEEINKKEKRKKEKKKKKSFKLNDKHDLTLVTR